MKGLNIIGRRLWFYTLSGSVILVGLVALLIWGLPLGIDFTGGTLIELQFEQTPTQVTVQDRLIALGYKGSVQLADDNVVVIKTDPLDEENMANTTATDVEQDEGTTIEESSESDTEKTDEGEVDTTTDSVSDSEATPTDVTDVSNMDDTQSTDISVEGDQNLIEPISDVSSQGTSGQLNNLISGLSETLGPATLLSYETIGPIVSQELARQSLSAVLYASIAIVLYIAWAFRKVPKPTSSFRFGMSAIVALIHDVVILVGMFAVASRFFELEVNTMFVVAALTVMGFSVHDSIVVFDRIREKLIANPSEPFERMVNMSVLETLGRSINTSFTLVLVLVALLLFGGESIFSFNLALLIGVITGTYSSIFLASPILVDWQRLATRTRKKSRKN